MANFTDAQVTRLLHDAAQDSSIWKLADDLWNCRADLATAHAEVDRLRALIRTVHTPLFNHVAGEQADVMDAIDLLTSEVEKEGGN